MPLDSIRNSHGDLTVHALRSGRVEIAAWSDPDRTITGRSMGGITVVNLRGEGTGFRVTRTDTFRKSYRCISLYFPEIKQARAEFKKRSRH